MIIQALWPLVHIILPPVSFYLRVDLLSLPSSTESELKLCSPEIPSWCGQVQFHYAFRSIHAA
jgi:hypothetical protein